MATRKSADCHAHVFCGTACAQDAAYTPHPSQAGTPSQFAAVLAAHGFTHGLLVGAKPYGTNNRCLLGAIAGSSGRFKGIALVRPDISDRDLTALADGGIVGVRVNLFANINALTEPGTERLLARMKEMNWILQIHCEKNDLVAAAPVLRKAGVRIMIDHFGRPDVSQGVTAPGFQTLLEFGKSGNAIVKLSGPFRSSLEGFPYRDVDPYIEAAIDAFTLDNCVWGSDWPYVQMDERLDYGPPLTCLTRWLPDAADRRKVLWKTPTRLFGFR